MGKVRKETGLLKLVRAGGIVEIYKHPILAAHIMERYPRHCVTRPDFFRFPYIVVKPESVLRPGKVFFIVPYYTVYRLFKSRVRNDNVSRKTHDQMENVDTSFFHKIVPHESIRNKKPSNNNLVLKDGDYDSDEAVAGGVHRNGCLKPCLKKNRLNKTRIQQGPRVRFTLPDEEDDDDEKWDTDYSEF